MFYNSIYDDGAFIDSIYIANLVNEIELSSGEQKVGLLFKLLNGYYFSNPELTKNLSGKALDLALETKNDSLIAYAYHYHGLAYIYLDYYKISNNYYEKGLSTNFAQKTDNYRSWVLMNMGNNYLSLEEYDLAAQNYYEALKLNEKIGNQAFAVKIYTNLSNLYFLTGNFSESIKNNELAIANADIQKDKLTLIELHTIRSNVSFSKDDINLAQFHFNSAISYAQELNDSLRISQTYYEYGEQLFDNRLYKKALKAFQDGIKYCNPNNYNLKYYTFLHGLGKSNLFLGNIQDAADQLNSARIGMEKHSAKEKLQKLELSISRLYAKTGDWEKFNIHYSKSEEYRLAHLKEKELHRINELKIAYDTEKKENEIANQKFQIAVKETQVWLLSIIAITILLILIGAIKFNKKLKEQNQKLFKQNLELSKRWEQLQKFYGSNEGKLDLKKSTSLFSQLVMLMNDELAYKKTDLHVEYCAKRLNTNIKYISNAIKNETGMNFNTFVNTYRIEEAKKLFLDPKSETWTLEAIAEECGFNNLTSFYQSFKNNTGLTPSNFRNTIAD